MCNFVLRPIKSYATIDIYNDDRSVLLISRGDEFKVELIAGDKVVGNVNDRAGLAVPLNVFIHAFTANLKDVVEAKKEESEWFPKPQEEKPKEAK